MNESKVGIGRRDHSSNQLKRSHAIVLAFKVTVCVNIEPKIYHRLNRLANAYTSDEAEDESTLDSRSFDLR